MYQWNAVRFKLFERARQTSQNKNSNQTAPVRKSMQCYAAIPTELHTAVVSPKRKPGWKWNGKRQHRRMVLH